MIRRIPLLLAAAALLAGVWACDSLSDPAKPAPAANTERVAGALTGDVPAGAHVAIVWRSEQGLTLGADAPLVNGRFSIDLPPPADELVTGSEGFGGDLDLPTFRDWSSTIDASALHVRTDVSGGVGDGQPLRFAYAGFIVYVDTNGNGKLDFDEAGTASDLLVGGSENLSIAYYRGGSSNDYEKLRGINGALPHEGYNLRYTIPLTQNSDRWFPLDQVQLEPGRKAMPESACERMSTKGGLPTHFADDAGVYIECSNNGQEYAIAACSTQDDAKALCWNGGYAHGHVLCHGGASFMKSDPPPPNWPCPPAADGGP